MNQRIIVDAVATAGVGFNTVISLYGPNGAAPVSFGTPDRLDYQLNASGTWTIVIEDNGDDTTGNYSLSFMNITAGPLENGSDTDGGPIASNQILTGNIQAGVDFDAYTFNALVGNRIVITGLATSGVLNTNLTLYPPNGGGYEVSTSSGDYIDVQLAQSGTYTLVVEDYANDDTGTYTVSMMNLTMGPHIGGGDTDGGAMTSGEVKTGGMDGIADMDVFTFQGSFGDRAIIDCVVTTGATFNTYTALYPPNGGPAVTATSGDRFEVQLSASGTWTLVIQDNGSDATGDYALSLLNVTGGPITGPGDSNGGTIVSNEIKNGSFQQGVDFDAYTFSGTAGQRVAILALATGAGSHNTSIALYPPGGGGAEMNTSSGDVIDAQLLTTGLYTIVVEDYGNDHTGTYTISFLNLTAGPLTGSGDSDGGPIASAAVKTGSMSGVADLDAYTFTGTAGDRVLVDCVATSGAGFNTYLAIYPPNGFPAATSTSADRMEHILTVTGTWTILIQDNGDDNAGNYELSLLNVTTGPHTTGSDTDGSALVSNGFKTGQFQQGVDFDAYTFTGAVGQRVAVTCLATGAGSHNTSLTLYPPGGLAAESASNSGDVIDVMLQHAGTYTVVVEDYGNDHTGAYSLSFMNVTAGPHTDGTDPDGGAIASSDVRSGTISGIGDIDCFMFTGTVGQRVLIDCVVTSGASLNTFVGLYAPNGGAALVATPTDRIDYQLPSSGTWTIMVVDNGLDNDGGYDLSLLNVTAGPITAGGDSDGGAIVSNEIKTGQFQQGVDFDAFTFAGNAGQRVVISGVATGGVTHNTTLSLYPPNGFAAETVTNSGDRIDWQLQRTGTYTIVIEDYGNDHAGGYAISLLNITAGPLTSGGDTNGGPITSNQVLTGTTSGVGDFDAFTFSANYGQRVLAIAVATAGAGYNTHLYAYGPGGAGALTSTTNDRIDFLCNASGTWTILIEDSGTDNPGSYTVSIVNITNGPWTGGGETDGGTIVDNVTRNGSIVSVADADAYRFYGVAGMTANITATATSGTLNTNIALYGPNGGAALQNTSGDNILPVLATNGYYTVVIEDLGNDETGNYSLNVNTSGGVTGVGGGTPPAELALHAAVPSPFSQSTRFDYDLPAGDRVRIDVFDVTGARIRGLVDDDRRAGCYAATWDGRDDRGERVASGVYYIRMQTRAEMKKQKVVLVR